MTIYDVKFYGLYETDGNDVLKVEMAKNEQTVLRKTGEKIFSATVLKSFEGKEDVLMLTYRDGNCEYETLYEPTFYYENGEWQETQYREAQKAFLNAFNNMRQESKEKDISIFDMTFYGAYKDMIISRPVIRIYASKEERRKNLSPEIEWFTATVHKSLWGKEYVVKLERKNAPCEYIQLFDSETSYCEKTSRWVQCQRSDIPEKIMECYLKYIED